MTRNEMQMSRLNKVSNELMTEEENGGHPLSFPLSHFRTCYTTRIKLLAVLYWDQPQQVWFDSLTFLNSPFSSRITLLICIKMKSSMYNFEL